MLSIILLLFLLLLLSINKQPFVCILTQEN